MESTLGSGSLSGVWRSGFVNVTGDGKTTLRVSTGAGHCCSATLLSVDEGAGKGAGGRDTRCDAWGAAEGAAAGGLGLRLYRDRF